MKTARFPGLAAIATALAVAAAGAAHADSMTFSSLDRNGDGLLSPGELTSALGLGRASALMLADMDGDGRISRDEAGHLVQVRGDGRVDLAPWLAAPSAHRPAYWPADAFLAD